MRQNLKKRVIIIALASIFLVAAALYYIPWPTRIDVDMICTMITEDGQALAEGTIQIKGWELDYLVKSDQLILDSFSLPGLTSPVEIPSDNPLLLIKTASPYYAPGFARISTTYEAISVSLQENWDTCLIRISSASGYQYFACSIDERVLVSNILEIHKWMLD